MDRDRSRTVSGRELLDRFEAPNGVVAEVWGEAAPYGFENLLHARVRLRARVPGSDRPYEHQLERIGVAPDAVDAVLREAAARLRRNLEPYLSHPAFPERFRARSSGRSRVLDRFPGAVA